MVVKEPSSKAPYDDGSLLNHRRIPLYILINEITLFTFRPSLSSSSNRVAANLNPHPSSRYLTPPPLPVIVTAAGCRVTGLCTELDHRTSFTRLRTPFFSLLRQRRHATPKARDTPRRHG